MTKEKYSLNKLNLTDDDNDVDADADDNNDVVTKSREANWTKTWIFLFHKKQRLKTRAFWCSWFVRWIYNLFGFRRPTTGRCLIRSATALGSSWRPAPHLASTGSSHVAAPAVVVSITVAAVVVVATTAVTSVSVVVWNKEIYFYSRSNRQDKTLEYTISS